MRYVLLLCCFLMLVPIVAADRACPDYCERDIQYINGEETREGCSYERIACPAGCDGAQCAEQREEPRNIEPLPSWRQEPREEPTTTERAEPVETFSHCPDVCRGNILYHDGRAARDGCQYEHSTCAFGCNTRINECNPPPPELLNFVEADHEETDDDGHEESKEEAHEEDAETEDDEDIPKNVVLYAPTRSGEQSTVTSGNTGKVNTQGITISAKDAEIIANDQLIQIRKDKKHVTIQNRVGDVIKKYGESKDVEVTTDEEDVPVIILTQDVPSKLFGLFPLDVETTIVLDAETLEKKEEKKPWWGGMTFPIGAFVTIDNYICKEQEDCKQFDSENLCNGRHYCDQSPDDPKEWRCKLLQWTVVTCGDNGKACSFEACNPNTGLCETQDMPEETLCEYDDNACTPNDHCEKGVCVADDWNYDNPVCQCQTQQDCKQYENGNLCDGTLYCDHDDNQCKVNPATEIKCGSWADTTCSQNQCNPQTGLCEMKKVNELNACDDGDKCTDGDHCSLGVCISGKTNVCECEHDADCAKLENGNVCDGTLYCDKSINKCKLNPASIITCPSVDDTSCRKNLCDPESGKCSLQPVNEGETCYSGHSCENAVCNSTGACVGTWDFTKILPNGNKCQCKQDSDCAPFENDNVCDGTLFCNKGTGTCELNPATKITCPSVDDTYCRENTCNPKTGACEMKPANTGKTCDLGHACIDSFCTDEGTCEGEWNFNKLLGNDKKCQCKEDDDCVFYEDGDACNGTLYCDKSVGTCKVNPSTIGLC